jgi:hypothetical protein
MYFRGNPFSFTVTLPVLFHRRECFFVLLRIASLLAIAPHLHLKLFPLRMRVKTLMTKNSVKRGTAIGWTVSTINKNDMKKAKAAGFLPDKYLKNLLQITKPPRPVTAGMGKKSKILNEPDHQALLLHMQLCEELQPEEKRNRGMRT